MADNPVAIVGLAGMFPSGQTVGEFWRDVVAAADRITDVPESHWRIADHYDPDPLVEDKTYCRRGGFLDPVLFDPREFGMAPGRIDSAGLVQLVCLLAARDVLADAGCDSAPWFDRSRTGVVLGVAGPNSSTGPAFARTLAPYVRAAARSCGLDDRDADEIARRFKAAFPGWQTDTFPGMLDNVAAGRVAHALNLGAMNCTVDAACASSHGALRMAISELLDGRADMMLTGGADVDNNVLMFLGFSKTPAFSMSGRIAPFAADADGTLIGEGVGLLALRRLRDAERDGNRIYAVIRGLGGSSDGRSSGIYAPDSAGQARALRMAYADARCEPGSVGLIEAHGTATPSGDEVELDVLNQVFAGTRVPVGSVKSQIGHTKAAAGAISLIKMAMSLYHKVLPPTINVDTPHAKAAGADAAVYVNTRTRPWIRDPRRPVRRGGVSSFGFGGTNFHAVLEEHDDASHAAHAVPKAYLWHAEDSEALTRVLEEASPEDEPQWSVPEQHARLGFVARDSAEFAAQRDAALAELRGDPEAFTKGGVVYRRRALPAGVRVAALFAGQGSQYPGMGVDATLAFPPLREAFDAANAVCAGEFLLSDLVFPLPWSEAGVDEERLRRTDVAQPAIGALAMGQYRVLTRWGFAPDAALGHSFGELTALWAAGAVDDTGFLRLATARGQAMAPVPETGGDPGAMAAVRCSADQAARLIADWPELVICNLNGPDDTVVGGATAAVDAFLNRCRAEGTAARRLPVAAAFHTRHVAHAVDRFAEAVAEVTVAEPRIPVPANTTGAEYSSDVDANRAVLVSQIVRPVDFWGRARQLHAEGYRVFVEFGPRSILSTLVDRGLADPEVVVVPTDLGPGTDSATALKHAAVRLAVLGRPIHDINQYDPVPVPRPAPSPVAKVLRGPHFAAETIAPAYQQLLATEHTLTSGPTAEPAAFPSQLAGLAAEHLALHRRYLDGQLRTTQDISGMVASGELDLTSDTVAGNLAAIRDHGLALGQAHTHAIEVFGRLLGSNTEPPPVPATRSAAEPVITTEPIRNGHPVERPATSPAGETTETTDDRDLGAMLRQVISAKTGYPPDMIEPDMDLSADLGVDSLMQVEIAADIWRRFPGVPREAMHRLADGRTVGDYVRIGESLFAETNTEQRAPLPLGRAFVELRTLPDADEMVAAYRSPARAVLIDDGTEVAAALVDALRASGWRVHVLALPGDERADSERIRLAGWSEDAIAAALSDVDQIDLCVLPMTEPTTRTRAIQRLGHAILVAKHVQEPLRATAATGTRAGFVTITALDGELGYAGSRADGDRALAGGLGGLCKVLALETRELFCRALDFAPDLPAGEVAAQFLRELTDSAAGLPEVGFDGHVRRHPIVSDTPTAPLVPRQDGPVADVTEDDLLLVTGGARGITAWCVTALARKYRCGLLLLGRTPLTDGPPGPAEQEVRTTLSELHALGIRAEYLVADVADAQAVRAVLRPYAGEVTGLIHGAGVLADQWLRDKTADTIGMVFNPKLAGLDNVLSTVDDDRLRHLVVFTSVAGVYGNLRQVDYATANEALNRFACAWRRAHPACRVSAIAFGGWAGGMTTPGMAAIWMQQGIPVLTREHGCTLFVEQMGPEHRDAGVTVLGPVRDPYDHRAPVPPEGIAVRRSLTRLAEHPVLRDHSIGECPVLPMTGAVGWCVDAVEHVRGSGAVVEVEDVRIRRGIVFDTTLPDQFVLTISPANTEQDRLAVAVRDDGSSGPARYDATLRLANRPDPIPRIDLAGQELPVFEQHHAYRDGPLFHGPSLRGLGQQLATGPTRAVFLASLPAPEFAGYTGALYHGASADVLLQAAGLFALHVSALECVPLSAGRIQLFAPLPDGEPYLVVVDLVAHRAVDVLVTVCACAEDGRVYQRWTDLSMVVVNAETVSRLTAAGRVPA